MFPLLKHTLIAAALLMSYHAFAEHQYHEDIFSISMEQLLDMRVSIVSNRDETIREAPAIVSRLERAEMEQLGLRTLSDIISFFPGFVVNTDPTARKPIMVRGLYDPDNQKILFLLDETPYWMSANGNIPLLGIPLSAIDSVEVIRGPGGVIYGTNASAGVIKVVTRKDKHKDVSFSLGNHDLATANAYANYQLGESDLSFALEGRHDSGYQAEAKNLLNIDDLSFSKDGSIHRAQEHISGLVKYNIAGLQVMAEAYQSTDTGAVNGLPANSFVRKDTSYLFGGHYAFDINQWHYKIYANYNRYHYRQDIDNLLTTFSIIRSITPPIIGDGNFEFENGGHDNFRSKIGATVSGQFTENLRFDVGFENEFRSSEKFSLTDDLNGSGLMEIIGVPSSTVYESGNTREISTFAQLNYTLESWRFNFGAHYTDNEDYGSQVTPKVSLVHQLNNQQSLKFIFSEGFSSPTFAQNRVVAPDGSPTVPDLEAETVQSSDIAYTYTNNRQNFVANAFYLEVKGNIERETDAGFTNTNNIIRRNGVEFDYNYSGPLWTVLANSHYLDQGNKEIENDATAFIAPKITAALGLNYKPRNHQFGLSLRYIGRRAGLDAYNLINLSYSWHKGPLNIFVDALNLLDETALQHNTALIQFPIQMDSEDGATARLGFKYQFD